MAVEGVSSKDSSDYSIYQGTQSTKKSSDSTNFMTILLAQLKNQDPMQPMSDTEYMAQMAQFNSLSELQELNDKISDMSTTYQNSYASSLIGKSVKAVVGDDAYEGVVTGFYLDDGTPMVYIGEDAVDINSIVEVNQE